MNRLKSVMAIFFLGLLGFGFSAVTNSEGTAEKDTNAKLTDYPSNNQVSLTPALKFEFTPLPYAYNALEPYIDKQTVEIHYTKHHKAAYDNLVNAVKGTEMETMDLPDIIRNISKYPEVVRNNAGSLFNHTFYWEGMRTPGGALPGGKLSAAVNKTFGTFDQFKKQFSDAGMKRYGSGWAWLYLDDKGNLSVCSTPNQDNPLMDLAEKKGIPLLTMDVWEHAYYLKYQNRRADYIEAFWNLINWEKISARYENALRASGLK